MSNLGPLTTRYETEQPRKILSLDADYGSKYKVMFAKYKGER
jgi:hypothetical protein